MVKVSFDKSSESSSSKCSEKIKTFCQKNERSLVILGLVLVILLAIVALGLIIAAGLHSSPVLLAAGVVLLLVAFVIMSAAAMQLALRKLNKELIPGNPSVVNISLNN